MSVVLFAAGTLIDGVDLSEGWATVLGCRRALEVLVGFVATCLVECRVRQALLSALLSRVTSIHTGNILGAVEEAITIDLTRGQEITLLLDPPIASTANEPADDRGDADAFIQ